MARQNGHLPDAGKLTVGEYLSQWLEQAEARLRPGTVDSYRTLARCHILPHIGDLRLSRLDPLRISRLYAALAKAGLSGRRRQMVHRLLHKTLSDARKWGLIASNPASVVDAPRREHRERTLWTPEQISHFLASVHAGEAGQYGSLFGFMLASGCRVGEALGLKWADVDWKAGAVRIERQLAEVRNRLVECPPKTKAGIRTISLPAWGLELLHRQKAMVAGWRLQSGSPFTWPDRVFITSTGTTPKRCHLHLALERTCNRLSLPRIRVHDLRHLHLSLLAMMGDTVKVAQQRAGHATASVTMAVYSHVLGDADRQAAEALEKAVGGR